jgi:hypothetical protein
LPNEEASGIVEAMRSGVKGTWHDVARGAGVCRRRTASASLPHSPIRASIFKQKWRMTPWAHPAYFVRTTFVVSVY